MVNTSSCLLSGQVLSMFLTNTPQVAVKLVRRQSQFMYLEAVLVDGVSDACDVEALFELGS